MTEVEVEVEDSNDVHITITGDNNVTNLILFSLGATITTSSGDAITNNEIEVNGEEVNV